MKLLRIQKSTVRFPHPERKNNFRLRAQMSASIWTTSLSTLIKSRALVWSVSFFLLTLPYVVHSPSFSAAVTSAKYPLMQSQSARTQLFPSSHREDCLAEEEKNLDFERNCCEKKKKQFLFRFFFRSKIFLFRRFPFVFGRSSFRPEFFLPPLSRF